MRFSCIAIVVLSLLSGHAVHACLWEHGTRIDGKPIPMSGLSRPGKDAIVISYLPGKGVAWGLLEEDLDSWKEKRIANGIKCDASGSVEACNDLAVALVHLGRSAEAIPLLAEIEKRTPGLYQTAVNLGTAFELSGQDELALKWITEGMRRNPQSHQGTEWLHARILEAKLSIKREPGWLQSHAVVDGTEAGPTGSAAAPVWRAGGLTSPSGQELSREDVARAIVYQLRERLQFVKPPDPIVADLLLELAFIVSLDDALEMAMPVLQFAEKFKPARTRQLVERRKYFETVIAANPDSGDRIRFGSDPSGLWLLLVPAIAIGVPVMAIVGWIRWRRRVKTAASTPADSPTTS